MHISPLNLCSFGNKEINELCTPLHFNALFGEYAHIVGGTICNIFEEVFKNFFFSDFAKFSENNYASIVITK